MSVFDTVQHTKVIVHNPTTLALDPNGVPNTNYSRDDRHGCGNDGGNVSSGFKSHTYSLAIQPFW